MTRFERDKEILFDILAEEIGAGAADNKIYYCNEIYCEDCLFNHLCGEDSTHENGAGAGAVRAAHEWLDKNFETQKEDIMDYLSSTIAIDKEWDNEYTKCNNILCSHCAFDTLDSGCTARRKKYLNEEV